MEKTNLTYQHAINEISHTFERGDNFGEEGVNPYHISILAGKRCEFCNHPIAWVWKIKNETGKVWEVGSECVFNLLKLEEEKRKAYKSLMAKIGRLERCRKKYADILNFIKQNIQTTSLWKLHEEGKITLNKNDFYRQHNKINEDCYNYTTPDCTCLNLKESELKEDYCPTHEIGSGDILFRCKTCLGLEIMRKIDKVGTLNEFWLNKFEELSGLKLPEKN